MRSEKGINMNTRLEEMARECFDVVIDNRGREDYSTDAYGLKKFAEMIVAESVRMCEFVACQAEITNTGEMARKTKATAESCAKMIQESFRS
jgi:hypothetical protein